MIKTELINLTNRNSNAVNYSKLIEMKKRKKRKQKQRQANIAFATFVFAIGLFCISVPQMESFAKSHNYFEKEESETKTFYGTSSEWGTIITSITGDEIFVDNAPEFEDGTLVKLEYHYDGKRIVVTSVEEININKYFSRG